MGEERDAANGLYMDNKADLESTIDAVASAITALEASTGLQIRASKFQSLNFKLKFPRARTYELIRARSRLYRSQILQFCKY